MAKTVKGLTIEIDGNTTKLAKALDDVTKESKNITSELRQVEKLLKFNPEDTVLLEQKQQLLAKAVQNTKEKLDTLEKAQDSVNQQFKNGEIGEEQYRAFQREIIQTKSQLDNFSNQLNDTEAELAYFSTGADKAADELKDLDKQAEKASDAIDDVGKKSENSTGKMAAVGYAVGEIGDKMSAASGKILEFGGALVEAYKETGPSIAKIEATAGAYGLVVDDVEGSLKKMIGFTGELDSSTEALNNLLSAGLNADQVAQAIDQFAGAVTQFPDTLKFESLADSLQESISQGAMTGQFAELLERLGYDIEKVNEDFAKASENGTAFDLAMQLLSDQGLAEVGDEFIELNGAMYENNQKNFELQESMATLGEKIMPLLNDLIGYAIEAVNWFTELDGTWQIVIGVIAGLIAIIGPLLSILGPLIILAGGLNVAMLPIIGTVAAVIAIIGAVIAIGVLLYKNWDTIKAKAGELWQNLKTTFSNIGSSISNAWNNVVSSIKSGWNTAVDFIRGIPGEMLQFGKNIIDGLVNGIKSKISAITNAIKEVTGKITGKVKSILGIASPSKVMFQMGEWTGEGLALGIEDTVSKVQKATQNLANRVTDTMGNSKLGTNTVVNNNMAVSPNDVVINLDGRTIARQTVRYTATELERFSNAKLSGRGIG